MSASRFFAGALVGVAIGMLIAPEKGSELREDIADTADKWKTKLDKLRGKAEASLEDLRALLDKNVEGLSEDVKHRILTILDDASEMAYASNKPVSNGVL